MEKHADRNFMKFDKGNVTPVTLGETASTTERSSFAEKKWGPGGELNRSQQHALVAMKADHSD